MIKRNFCAFGVPKYPHSYREKSSGCFFFKIVILSMFQFLRLTDIGLRLTPASNTETAEFLGPCLSRQYEVYDFSYEFRNFSIASNVSVRYYVIQWLIVVFSVHFIQYCRIELPINKRCHLEIGRSR